MSTRYALTEIDILASLQWLMLFHMQAPPMEASQTPNGALASDPVSQLHTPESLVLHDLFQSRSLLLQYLSGMMDAYGSISIHRKGGALRATVRFAQSNLAFLTAINAEFDYTGYISTHSAAGKAANVNEGRYSKGELRQMLTFVGKAAGDVAAELQPYTVTKAPHIEILLDMLKHPASPSRLSARQQCYLRMQVLYSKAPDDNALVDQNITPAWMAGMFDGDGCIVVTHHLRTGRSALELNITQSKSPALLLAIQAVHTGTIQCNPHRLVWRAARNIPAIARILRMHLVIKRILCCSTCSRLTSPMIISKELGSEGLLLAPAP